MIDTSQIVLVIINLLIVTIQESTTAATPSRRWGDIYPNLYNDSANRPYQSESGPSIVDEILSRPVYPPLRHSQEGVTTRSEDLTSLSKDTVAAIYEDYVNAASSRCSRHSVVPDENQLSDESYDFQEVVYGSDEEEEIYGEEGSKMIGTADGFKYVAPSKSRHRPVWQSEDIRRIFDKAWLARGLTLDMEPQDLAFGVANVEIDLYEYDMNPSIGILASKLLKQYGKGVQYRSEYRFWSRKYTSTLKHIQSSLKEKEETSKSEIPLDERKILLKTKLAKSYSGTYDDWKRTGSGKMPQREADAMSRARRAGEKILEIAKHAKNDARLRLKDLSIAEIEYYSRQLDGQAEGEDKVTKESIKKLLRKYLNKEDKDINEFSRLRLDHKQAYFDERQRKIRKQQRQNRS